MAELGPDAAELHRRAGAELAELGVDELIAVGELARDYLPGANGVPARWVATASEAADALRAELRPGDVVLLKGSRTVGLEAVGEKITA
jgi:UDP-N-acetylmuramoyl-tripeptide--D-alanyl-D-alanine ligase